jgi:hypothetical protein
LIVDSLFAILSLHIFFAPERTAGYTVTSATFGLAPTGAFRGGQSLAE